MSRRVWPFLCATAVGLCLSGPGFAQAPSATPLSVIEWLEDPTPAASMPRAPQVAAPTKKTDEPAVASSGTAPKVTTRALGAGPARNVGLAPPALTGIAPDLWAGSDPEGVARRIHALPELGLPAGDTLLFTLLLAEAQPPTNGDPKAQDTLTLARMRKLMQLGAVDPALALAAQADAETSPALFDLWADLSLLIGTEDSACGALSRGPYLSKNTALRIFCAARSGDWNTAALTFSTAQALGLAPRDTLAVLDRFLNPDLFEDAAPLPAPRSIDPLTFRLFETIGEPLSTSPLPRAFAVADLRDIAGWKSQLEAAERLTRTGALADNRLLGLYTDRKAAASGGIWDHVRAVQGLDAALGTGDPEAVSKTLPFAWGQMRRAELEVSFSTLFFERLKEIELTGAAATIAARMGLLSPEYEAASQTLGPDAIAGLETALLRGVAIGEFPQSLRNTPPTQALPRAVFDAFNAPAPRADWMEMAKEQRLGEALLLTLASLRDGARGDSRALRDALGTLRALGLEDTARRASLQILLLERDT